ncbi:hypothetical protein [Saccharothrix obliqua]|uniref:hypothetical protein n=1 Tax=Saccharothrix obliqua TaxID=2861747 RepID=UPI001C5F87BD|nr:hypothetical protein [Saccharothrix obliqua]MBW4717078.1 hypothetical protein [Saccharothrix obliqua]
MEHPHGGLDVVGTSSWTLALRLVLLLATAFVAGAGLVTRVPVPGGATTRNTAREKRNTARETTETRETSEARQSTVPDTIGAAQPPMARSNTANAARSTVLQRNAVRVTVGAAAVAVVLAVVSVAVLGVHVAGAAVHVGLVVAVPALSRWPGLARGAAVLLVLLLVVETAAGGSGVEFVVDTAYVAAAAAWFGVALSGSGTRPLVLTLGVALVAAGVTRLVTSGVAVDRRLVTTPLGLVLLAAVVSPVVAVALRGRRVAVVGVVLGFVAWSALAAVPRPAELPTPGVPVLAEVTLAGQRVPVLVTPHRPGRNLVHLPASAVDGVRVAAGGPPSPALPRVGAEGTWAEVDLPAGRGDVVLSVGDDSASVDVDTGDGPAVVVDPECASAALGGLIAGRREPLTTCPADRLPTEDEESLRRLVDFLRDRGAPGVTLAADTTTRGTRAAAAVRAAAAEAGIRVDAEPKEDNALLVVSGWEAAHAALDTATAQQAERPVYAHGLYVAPWLLTTPLVSAVTTVSVPLRFDPREPLPVGYAVALGNGFGGANPTPAGFTAWQGGRPAAGGVRVFAAAQVTVMPMGPGEPHAPGMPMSEELAGQWVPKATVVPVSELLT